MKILNTSQYKLNNLKVFPENVKVRSYTTITVTFFTSFDLPENSCLTFRFRGGRNNKNDWYYLQSEDPNEKGHATLNLSNSTRLLPVVITGKELLIKYLILEPAGIPMGTEFRFNIKNTLVQSLVENNKKIEILIKFPNQKPILLGNPPVINVINEEFDHITIICPSIIAIREEFKILIRIEDKFKNLVRRFSDVIQLFFLTENAERTNVKSVEFKKEFNGVLKVDGLMFSSPGVHFIEAQFTDSRFRSNPISCKLTPAKKNLFWGFIHGHTLKSDGIRDLEEYFENLIKAGLDFGTSTEHDHQWETSDEDFEEIKKIVKKYNKDKDFVSFFGYEYGTWYSGYGDICIYYYDDNLPILRSDTNKYNSTTKLIKNLKKYEGKITLIAHHTALRTGYRNWDYFDNSLERLVEIYSTWGNQEYSFSDGNPLPPRYKFFGHGKHAKKRGAILEKRDHFIKDALNRGYKLGFTCGGDDHFGVFPSGEIDPDNGIYPPGIMAIWANDLTKESLWGALQDRKCYGTTGPRVIIEFWLNDYFMGDIVNIKENPGLKQERKIRLNVISPINIERVEIIRNNEIIKKKFIGSNKTDLSYKDNSIFKDMALSHVDKNELFIFYYIRVFLLNENMAWSSPIWIIEQKL